MMFPAFFFHGQHQDPSQAVCADEAHDGAVDLWEEARQEPPGNTSDMKDHVWEKAGVPLSNVKPCIFLASQRVS